MNILDKVSKASNRFSQENRVPASVIVLNPGTARLAYIEAREKKGILTSNGDRTYLLFGMIVIEKEIVKVNDIVLLHDTFELDAYLKNLYR